MDYPSLLQSIEDRVTQKMKDEFYKEFFEDEFNKHLSVASYKVDYYNAKGDFSGFSKDNSDLTFLMELMEYNILKVFPIEDSQSFAKEINSSVHDFYRYQRLSSNGPFLDYNQKLDFVFSQYSNYFNVFRTYYLSSRIFSRELQSLSCFSVFPSNKFEIDDYILFLEKYLTPSGDYRVLYGSNQKTTEYFIQEFVNQLSHNNYKSFISEYLKRLEQIYPVGKYEDIYSISIDFYRNLKKYNLSLKEFLYTTSDPFIYFLTLFFRKKSQPIGELKYFLETFEWEKERDKVLYLSKVDFDFSPKAGYESKGFIPNDQGKYTVYYSNFEQRSTFEQLFSEKILKDDFRVIYRFLKDLHVNIFNVSEDVDLFITKKINELNIILPSLENSKIMTLFIDSIIPLFSKGEILQISPLVWHTFTQAISSFKKTKIKQSLPPKSQNLSEQTKAVEYSNNLISNGSTPAYGRELTNIESEILKKLNTILLFRIESKIEDHKSKDKLYFSACTSEVERIKYIKKEIKKYKQTISKCPPNIAEFCHAYLIDYHFPYLINQNEHLSHICGCFLQEELYEPLEKLNKNISTLEDLQILENEFWESFLIYSYNDDEISLERKNVKLFIKYLTLTERNRELKEILTEFEIKGQIKSNSNELKHLITQFSDELTSNIESQLTFNLDDDLRHATTIGIKSITNGFRFRKEMTQDEIKTFLDSHHDLLYDNNFISKNISNFRNAYQGAKEFNKILWKGSFPELKYYFKKLSKKITNENFWVIASQIYLKPDGSEFTNQELSRTKKNKGEIKEHHIIDKIV